MTGMDLPEEKGTYVLIASVPQMKRIEIGRLGLFDIVPGYYAYVGSAFGSGGLRARLGHHLEPAAEPHWHIDYPLQVAQALETWCTTADRRTRAPLGRAAGKGSAVPSPGSDPLTTIAPAPATCFIPSAPLPLGGLNSGSRKNSKVCWRSDM